MQLCGSYIIIRRPSVGPCTAPHSGGLPFRRSAIPGVRVRVNPSGPLEWWTSGMAERNAVRRPGDNDLGPYQRDQSTSRADRWWGRRYHQYRTARRLPLMLSIVAAQTQLQTGAASLQCKENLRVPSAGTLVGPPSQCWEMYRGILA